MTETEKQLEIQSNTPVETTSPQSSVEVESGSSSIKVDLQTRTEPQQEPIPTSPVDVAPESKDSQPTTSTIRTTGDRWNAVIREKGQNLPPRVL